MSFKADLYVGDNKYKILACDYELSQSVDHKNKPSSHAKGGLINATVEANPKDANSDRFLFDWMVSDTQIKNGHIDFIKPNSMAVLKKLSFTNAYCVNFRELFEGEGNRPMRIELVISAEKLSLGGSSEHQNTWSLGQ